MEDLGKKRDLVTGERTRTEQGAEEGAYPASIQGMSEKWRSIQQQGGAQGQRGFFERHYLALGIFLGLLFIALLVVIGGFAFLVWNAR